MMKLLQQLVQIKSTSGHEENLAGFILDYCQKKKIAAQKQKGNVIVHMKGTDNTRALIFNAHMDTVSPADISKWKYPPFGKGAGKIVRGKLYGLGGSDDKAAIAVMLILAEIYNKRVLPPYNPSDLRGKRSSFTLSVAKDSRHPLISPPVDLWFTFVTDEETDGSGTAAFLEWFTRSKYFKAYKYIAAIIGEPTSLKSVEIGHRGNAFMKLVTHGVSTHAAHEYEDHKLAVPQMLTTISKLQKAFVIWKKKYQDAVLGTPGMNITNINTISSAMKKIPGICEATLDIRTTPKLHSVLMKLMQDLLGENILIEELHPPQPAGYTSSHSPIIRLLAKLFPEIPKAISVGSTDLFQFAGRGIDAVVFGPGNMKTIHKENEYVELSKLTECVKLYKNIILAFSKI